ncbi:hypothetical protein [Streptomyces sp. NPDC005009]
MVRRRLLNPAYAAGVFFRPVWIPEPLDPDMEELRRARGVAGLLTYCGVYTMFDGGGLDGFGIGTALHNLSQVVFMLVLVHPVTVGVMLLVWKRRGCPVRTLRTPVLRGFVLLAGYVGAMLVLMRLTFAGPETGTDLKADMVRLLAAFWMLCFVVFASLAVVKNFFGSAAVHPCLPALLAVIVAWPAALPDVKAGGAALNVVLVLGGPVTITALAALEISRLRRYHGIRLLTFPHTPPQL